MSAKIWLIIFFIIFFVIAPAGFPFGVFFNLFGRHKAPKNSGRRRNEFLARIKIPYEFSEIKISSAEGLDLFGDYISIGSKKTVLLIHGYRSCPYVNFSTVNDLYIQQGFNVLMIYQRALGKSGGKFCGMGMSEQYDVLEWIKWLEENTSAEKIVVHGASMGAATLAYLSSKIKSEKVKALVIDSCYTSVYEQMENVLNKNKIIRYIVTRSSRALGLKLAKVDIKDSTVDSLKDNYIPVIFLYGEKDETIPFIFVEKCFNINPGEKVLIKVPDAVHIKSLETGGPEIQNQFFKYLNNYIEEE